MIARLVERGDMRWDMTPAEVFPDMTIEAGWRDVTLEHLLSHTSGAKPNMPIKYNLQWPKTQDALRAARLEIVSHTLSEPPQSPAGETMVYSNLGYVIAGTMAEHVSGKTWEDLVRAEVFEPLGLESAGFGPPGHDGKTAQPWGHQSVWFFKRAANPEEQSDNSPIMGPAGTVHLSLTDALTYGQAHLDGLKGRSDYLSPDTFQKLHMARLNDYALGWVEYEDRAWAGGPVSWHNGSNTMWHAILMIAPEKETVVFIATNDGSGTKKERAIVTTISDIVKDLKN